jgi:hypothetical protein
MDYGFAFLSAVDIHKDVALAERKGFTHAWLYDTQMICDPPISSTFANLMMLRKRDASSLLSSTAPSIQSVRTTNALPDTQRGVRIERNPRGPYRDRRRRGRARYFGKNARAGKVPTAEKPEATNKMD